MMSGWGSLRVRWTAAVGVAIVLGTGTWLLQGSLEKEEELIVPRHVILIVIDTLRADVVEEVDTPVLDALALEGDRVSVAWTSATWTAPSVISIFTGMPVRSHGWDFPFPAAMDNRTRSYPKVPDVPVLAEVLGDAGFQTNAFYGNQLLSQGLGYDRGFDSFRGSGDRTLPRRLKALLAEQDLSQRQFLYLHMFGGHQPLRPSAESARKWNVDSALIKGRGFALSRAKSGNPAVQNQYTLAYRGVVEDIDSRLGDVLDALEPLREDALIIVTSDHGEMLGEHGRFGHGRWVYEPLTRVPFVAVGAGDLPETLSLSAIPDLITRTVGVEAEWLVSIEDHAPLVAQREGKLAFTLDGRIKGIWDAQEFESGLAVFDLATDPEEKMPVSEFETELKEELKLWQERTPHERLKSVDGSMSDEMLDALEDLGYMD